MNNNLLNLDWEELRVFFAVLEEGSLSRAAKSLGLSQPTVSRRIDALEQRLGSPLLERSTQGTQPTAQGALLVPLIEQMQRASEGIQRIMTSTTPEVSGIVKVACGEMVGRLIARHSWSLLAGAPQLQLEVLTGMGYVNLERGDAHIAVRLKRPESGQLYAKQMAPTPYAIYATPHFVETYPASLTEERYTQCRWATFVPELSHLSSASWLQERLHPDTRTLRFGTSGLILEAAASGVAMALLPLFIGDDDPRLRRVTEPIEELSMQGYLVLHRDTRKLPRVRLIADRIDQLLHKLYTRGQTHGPAIQSR